MSYSFCALLYRVGRFDPEIVREHMEEMDQSAPKERMVDIAVGTGDVRAIFYDPGNTGSQAGGFGSGCEFFLLDDLADALLSAAADIERPHLLSWVSSDSFPYNLALMYDGGDVEGRLIIGDDGERISIKDGAVQAYEHVDISVDPDDFGGEDDLDEGAYQAAVDKQAKPFEPSSLVKQLLDVTREDVTLALTRLDDGEMLWPNDNTDLADEPPGESVEYTVPAPPLWAWMNDQATASPDDNDEG